MIVDDDQSIRYLVRINLEGADKFEVIGEAENGDEAVKLVERDRPDFVILDLFMPRMDGAEAAGAMREVHPTVRIVAYSGNTLERPEWADASLNKEQFSLITSVLDSLV